MYIPKFNEEKRLPVMRALIESHPLATLITLGSAGLFATHLPMILHDDGTEFGTLKGHIARANAQWKDFVPSVNSPLSSVFAVPKTKPEKFAYAATTNNATFGRTLNFWGTQRTPGGSSWGSAVAVADTHSLGALRHTGIQA